MQSIKNIGLSVIVCVWSATVVDAGGDRGVGVIAQSSSSSFMDKLGTFALEAIEFLASYTSSRAAPNVAGSPISGSQILTAGKVVAEGSIANLEVSRMHRNRINDVARFVSCGDYDMNFAENYVLAGSYLPGAGRRRVREELETVVSRTSC